VALKGRNPLANTLKGRIPLAAANIRQSHENFGTNPSFQKSKASWTPIHTTQSHASHKFVLTCTYLHPRHDLLTFYYNNHRGWLCHVTYFLLGSTKIGQRFNFILYCLFVELGNKVMYYIACTKLLCKAKMSVGVWQCEKLISWLVRWVLHKSCERVCKGNWEKCLLPLVTSFTCSSSIPSCPSMPMSTMQHNAIFA
jgi:hypothetical protein